MSGRIVGRNYKSVHYVISKMMVKLPKGVDRKMSQRRLSECLPKRISELSFPGMNSCARWTRRALPQRTTFSKDRFVKNKCITWTNRRYSRSYKHMAGSEHL